MTLPGAGPSPQAGELLLHTAPGTLEPRQDERGVSVSCFDVLILSPQKDWDLVGLNL